jgi:hypothetical protein
MLFSYNAFSHWDSVYRNLVTRDSVTRDSFTRDSVTWISFIRYLVTVLPTPLYLGLSTLSIVGSYEQKMFVHSGDFIMNVDTNEKT